MPAGLRERYIIGACTYNRVARILKLPPIPADLPSRAARGPEHLREPAEAVERAIGALTALVADLRCSQRERDKVWSKDLAEIPGISYGFEVVA